MTGAAAVAALALAAPCPATPVHGEPLPASGGLSGLRWVQATPHRAGIVGLLFADDPRLQPTPAAPIFALWTGGVAPDGRLNMKVLWIVRNMHVGGMLSLRGRLGDGRVTFRQSFPAVVDASPRPAAGTEFASIVRLPRAGCWTLDVRSGGARGTLVVRGVAP